MLWVRIWLVPRGFFAARASWIKHWSLDSFGMIKHKTWRKYFLLITASSGWMEEEHFSLLFGEYPMSCRSWRSHHHLFQCFVGAKNSLPYQFHATFFNRRNIHQLESNKHFEEFSEAAQFKFRKSKTIRIY